MTRPRVLASAFLLYFLLHSDLWRQCVCTLENVEFVLIVPGWFQGQKFSLPNTAFLYDRLQRTQTITWSLTGAYHHFSSFLIAFAWTSLGSEHPLVVLPAHSKSLSPPYRQHTITHRNTMWDKFLYCQCIYNKGIQNKQTWDVWTWESFMMWQQLKKLPKQVVVGLCLFYTAFLSYPVAPTFFVCSMCYQADGWSAATKQVLCGFEGEEKSMAPKCSQLCTCFLPALMSYPLRPLPEILLRTGSACTLRRCSAALCPQWEGWKDSLQPQSSVEDQKTGLPRGWPSPPQPTRTSCQEEETRYIKPMVHRRRGTGSLGCNPLLYLLALIADRKSVV